MQERKDIFMSAA